MDFYTFKYFKSGDKTVQSFAADGKYAYHTTGVLPPYFGLGIGMMMFYAAISVFFAARGAMRIFNPRLKLAPGEPLILKDGKRYSLWTDKTIQNQIMARLLKISPLPVIAFENPAKNDPHYLPSVAYIPPGAALTGLTVADFLALYNIRPPMMTAEKLEWMKKSAASVPSRDLLRLLLDERQDFDVVVLADKLTNAEATKENASPGVFNRTLSEALHAYNRESGIFVQMDDGDWFAGSQYFIRAEATPQGCRISRADDCLSEEF